MPTIYCISGLGADHHIFDRLELPGCVLAHLPWLTPADDEAIESYAARMRAGIAVGGTGTGGATRPVSGGIRRESGQERPIVLGVSFGGMMAIEIAKFLPDPIVIIVSSIRDRHQLPRSIRMSGRLVGKSWAPPANHPWLAPLQDYFLGVENEDDARIARQYRGNVDPRFLRWAIRRIALWKNEWRPAAFYHLHGTKDRTFPIRLVEPTHRVEGGGHLMIHNRAAEISKILAGLFGE
jgi:pimeloyl-ACP methyl ester carboxylesterase